MRFLNGDNGAFDWSSEFNHQASFWATFEQALNLRQQQNLAVLIRRLGIPLTNDTKWQCRSHGIMACGALTENLSFGMLFPTWSTKQKHYTGCTFSWHASGDWF